MRKKQQHRIETKRLISGYCRIVAIIDFKIHFWCKMQDNTPGGTVQRKGQIPKSQKIPKLQTKSPRKFQNSAAENYGVAVVLSEGAAEENFLARVEIVESGEWGIQRHSDFDFCYVAVNPSPRRHNNNNRGGGGGLRRVGMVGRGGRRQLCGMGETKRIYEKT